MAGEVDGITALVRDVRRASIDSAVTFIVTGSTSAGTGTAPAWMTALAVAQNVRAGTITSSPGPMPAASALRCSAAVHELTAIA
jgi:hypothetical protein